MVKICLVGTGSIIGEPIIVAQNENEIKSFVLKGYWKAENKNKRNEIIYNKCISLLKYFHEYTDVSISNLTDTIKKLKANGYNVDIYNEYLCQLGIMSQIKGCSSKDYAKFTESLFSEISLHPCLSSYLNKNSKKLMNRLFLVMNRLNDEFPHLRDMMRNY